MRDVALTAARRLRASPAAPGATRAAPRGATARPAQIARGMARIPGGPFLMGGDDPDAFPDDGEGPVREVTVSALPDRCDRGHATVSSPSSSRDTDYVTDAERFGWSFVFASSRSAGTSAAVREGIVPDAPWWLAVDGANWRAPRDRDPHRRSRRPPGRPRVVARRRGVRRVGRQAPADRSRVGERGPRRPRPGAVSRGATSCKPGGAHRCNIWQGRFPADQHRRRRLLAPRPSRVRAQRLRALQHVRQRLGVVRRLVERDVARRGDPGDAPGSARAGERSGQGDARRIATCAMRRTATAIASPPAPATGSTAAPDTSGFVVRPS